MITWIVVHQGNWPRVDSSFCLMHRDPSVVRLTLIGVVLRCLLTTYSVAFS